MIEQGLANAVGLRTLRHGTNPLSWCKIHLFGTDPNQGGKGTGGDGHFDLFWDRNINRTYFTFDVPRKASRFAQDSHDKHYRFMSLWPRVIPKTFLIESLDSSLAIFKKKPAIHHTHDQLQNLIKATYWIVMIGALFCLPTIKIRMTVKELSTRTEIDKQYPVDASSAEDEECTYYSGSTQTPMLPCEMGLRGTLSKLSLNEEVRFLNFLHGVTQMAVGSVSLLLLNRYFPQLRAYKKTCLAATLLAVV